MTKTMALAQTQNQNHNYEDVIDHDFFMKAKDELYKCLDSFGKPGGDPRCTHDNYYLSLTLFLPNYLSSFFIPIQGDLIAVFNI